MAASAGRYASSRRTGPSLVELIRRQGGLDLLELRRRRHQTVLRLRQAIDRAHRAARIKALGNDAKGANHD